MNHETKPETPAVPAPRGDAAHGGGLPRFLELNNHAPIWVNPHAFDAHFNAQGKDIGLSPALTSCPQLRTAQHAVQELAPGITLYQASCVPCRYPAAGVGMSAIIGGKRVTDDFRHEQYLLIEEHGKRILISGCSHRGILNLVTHFRPDVLIGGFHLMRSNAETCAQTGKLLASFPTRYYTGHCTGDTATEILRHHMQDQLQTFSTGSVWEV